MTAAAPPTRMESSDRDVIARVRSGDADAYRVLVVRYYPNALRYALRMLGNRDDAEEAAQDAFARAYRFLARFDGTRPFEGWLFGILANCCRDAAAARRRTEEPLVSYEFVAELEGDPTGGAALPDERRQEIQRAIMRLPPLLREAFLLKYLDDRTYEEIAQSTGTRVSALKMRVKRARAQIEAFLRQTGDLA